MSEETELKLEVPAAALRRLERAPWVRELIARSGRRQSLVSVYFDTADWTLRNRGVSLRIRRDGGRKIQTIKAAPAGTATPFARSEWEEEIRSDVPVLALAKNTALEPLVDKQLESRLKPLFETRIERIAFPVQVARSEIEVALDRGTIRAGRKSRAVSEIELELKRGEIQSLVTLARRLSQTVSPRYGAKTKSDRGYALARRAPEPAAHAEPVALDRQATAAAAFKAVGFSCLQHLALNEDGVREGDPEAIHQMRVGLRRLQAAIACFKDLLEDTQSAFVKAECKWLREQLGPARDMQVFVTDRLAPAKVPQPRKREVANLRAGIDKRRRAGLKLAAAAVRGERYRQFVLESALWLAGGRWCTSADSTLRARRNRSMVAFSKQLLGRRNAKLRGRLGKIERMSPGQRHETRIAAKKLRYCSEFLAGLYTADRARARRKKFVELLRRLQDDLGMLNDIAVHRRLAISALRDSPAPGRGGERGREASLALGLLTGREHDRVKPLLKSAAKVARCLAKLPPFWK